nr:hypothetical protein [uncultured organism]
MTAMRGRSLPACRLLRHHARTVSVPSHPEFRTVEEGAGERAKSTVTFARGYSSSAYYLHRSPRKRRHAINDVSKGIKSLAL